MQLEAMDDMPSYQSGDVVFIRVCEQEYSFRQIPAIVLCKCSYGTYKVRPYGSKTDEYVSEYQIELYSQEVAAKIKEEAGKKNKKMIKYLKSAEKDVSKATKLQEKKKLFNIECKQEEAQGEVQEKRENVDQSPSYQRRSNLEKYQAIQNMKISNVICDFKSTGLTKYYCKPKGIEMVCEEKSKHIIFLKLLWGFDDLIFHFDPEIQKPINLDATENLIHEIMESQVLEPLDYVTSPLLKKMQEANESIKKSKRPKMKIYLNSRHDMILKGFESHLKNYTMFMRVCQKFRHEEKPQMESPKIT